LAQAWLKAAALSSEFLIPSGAMARLALALVLLSARALADEGCAADGACQADEAETSALLQSSAARKAEVAQHSVAMDRHTTETTTLTCYPNYAAATCGASMMCFKDTSGCSASGAGVCCKAAGNGAGLEQCKFCGDSTCGPCPTGPTPAPTPSPTPAPTPSGLQVGEQCGNYGSTGQYLGECMSGLVCAPPANAAIGTANVCANICGSFDSNGDQMTGGCNRMQSCSCRAATPCYTWKPGAEGCYMYCC